MRESHYGYMWKCKPCGVAWKGEERCWNCGRITGTSVQYIGFSQAMTVTQDVCEVPAVETGVY